MDRVPDSARRAWLKARLVVNKLNAQACPGLRAQRAFFLGSTRLKPGINHIMLNYSNVYANRNRKALPNRIIYLWSNFMSQT